MENEHVLGGLLRKRAEVAGRLEDTQSAVRRLVIDLDSIDTTIRMFDPAINLAELQPRARSPRDAAYHGEISRPIYDALRGSAEAITTHAMTLRVMAARGLSAADKATVRSMQKRVGAALRHMRLRGAVQAEQRDGGHLWWVLA